MAQFDYEGLTNALRQQLRLRSEPLALKLFESAEAMNAVAGLRRPKPGVRFSMCQLIGQVRWLGWTLIGLVLLGLVAAGGGYWWLLRSLPQVDGEIAVAGLGAPVSIVRDRFAIPHIAAASLLDATFALGFVHAQDRLWQMEFRRRLFSKIVPNVKSLGLLSDRQRRRFQDLGILEFEVGSTSDADHDAEFERKVRAGELTLSAA